MSQSPYAPPVQLEVSALSNDIDIQKPGIFWKIYFFFILILLISSVIFEFIGPPIGLSITITFIDITLSTITTAGVFGFVYSKKLFGREYWKFHLFLVIFWDSCIFFSRSYNNLLLEMIIPFIIILVFITPSYIAIYKYSHGDTIKWSPFPENP